MMFKKDHIHTNRNLSKINVIHVYMVVFKYFFPNIIYKENIRVVRSHYLYLI